MVKIKCCGLECSTRFCPHCGAEVRCGHSLDGLVKHCQTRAAALRTEIGRLRDELAQFPDAPEWQSRRLPRAERSAKEWENWAEELSALLAAQTTIIHSEQNGAPPSS